MFGVSGGLGVLVVSGELQALAEFWKGPNSPILCVCVFVCVCVCVCVRVCLRYT